MSTEVPVAIFSVVIGLAAGILEGRMYSLRFSKRPRAWLVAVEQCAITLLTAKVFMIVLIALVVQATGIDLEVDTPSPKINLFWWWLFVPAFAVSSTFVLVRRWRREVKNK